MKPLVRLLQADLDVEQELAYYAVEAPHMELSFLDVLEKRTADSAPSWYRLFALCPRA